MQSFTNNKIFGFSLFHLLIVLIFMITSFGTYGKVEKVSTQTVTEKASTKNLEQIYNIRNDKSVIEYQNDTFITFELHGYEKQNEMDGSFSGCDCQCMIDLGSYMRNTTDDENTFFVDNPKPLNIDKPSGSIPTTPYAIE